MNVVSIVGWDNEMFPVIVLETNKKIKVRFQ